MRSCRAAMSPSPPSLAAASSLSQRAPAASRSWLPEEGEEEAEGNDVDEDEEIGLPA